MKIKVFVIVIIGFLSVNMFAQANLNNYKYVIVPKKFDFLKEANQYRLNELAEFLFEKYGFVALMEGEDYPEDLSLNRCLALRSDVIKDSGLFKTKLNMELKDCNDRVVFTSPTGESREKDYATAYNEAMRSAFETLESLNYQYEPSKIIAASKSQPKPKDNPNNAEIAQLKAEIESLKQEKQSTAKLDKPMEVVVSAGPAKPITPKPDITSTKTELEPVLYAQAIENGYQLVDSTPKVVYKLQVSGLQNVFFVEGKQAIVYKKGDIWLMEYYEGNNLKQETLPIKF